MHAHGYTRAQQYTHPCTRHTGIHVHMHMAHTCMHIGAHVQMCMGTQAHTCTWVCMRMDTDLHTVRTHMQRVCTQAHRHVHRYTLMYMAHTGTYQHMHTCMHMCVHTHVHTGTHTCSRGAHGLSQPRRALPGWGIVLPSSGRRGRALLPGGCPCSTCPLTRGSVCGGKRCFQP